MKTKKVLKVYIEQLQHVIRYMTPEVAEKYLEGEDLIIANHVFKSVFGRYIDN